MNSIYTRHWMQHLKAAYESSEWTDSAGTAFASREIPDMLQGLVRLGEAGDNTEAFLKKAEELLRS